MKIELAVAAALLVIFALVVLWKLFHRSKPKAWIQSTVCPNCGWSGQTSRYAGRCPKCNAPIGDQRVKRPQ